MSDRTKILLLLAPALSIIIILFFGGLFVGLLRSFNYMPIIGLTEPNFEAYINTFKYPAYTHGGINIIGTIISVFSIPLNSTFVFKKILTARIT